MKDGLVFSEYVSVFSLCGAKRDDILFCKFWCRKTMKVV